MVVPVLQEEATMTPPPGYPLPALSSPVLSLGRSPGGPKGEPQLAGYGPAKSTVATVAGEPKRRPTRTAMPTRLNRGRSKFARCGGLASHIRTIARAASFAPLYQAMFSPL